MSKRNIEKHILMNKAEAQDLQKKAKEIKNRYNFTEWKKEKAALERLRQKFADEVRSIL